MVEVNVALVDDEFDGYKLSSGTPLVQHLVAAPAPFTPQPHSSDTALVCVEAFALHNTVLATCEDCILYLSKLDGLVFLNPLTEHVQTVPLPFPLPDTNHWIPSACFVSQTLAVASVHDGHLISLQRNMETGVWCTQGHVQLQGTLQTWLGVWHAQLLGTDIQLVVSSIDATSDGRKCTKMSVLLLNSHGRGDEQLTAAVQLETIAHTWPRFACLSADGTQLMYDLVLDELEGGSQQRMDVQGDRLDDEDELHVGEARVLCTHSIAPLDTKDKTTTSDQTPPPLPLPAADTCPDPRLQMLSGTNFQYSQPPCRSTPGSRGALFLQHDVHIMRCDIQADLSLKHSAMQHAFAYVLGSKSDRWTTLACPAIQGVLVVDTAGTVFVYSNSGTMSINALPSQHCPIGACVLGTSAFFFLKSGEFVSLNLIQQQP
eukprot:m.188650 g.188650  ORF g.188650 m.188650 type:complete len:430 (-) comp14788_c0_seq2:125-1414(-)